MLCERVGMENGLEEIIPRKKPKHTELPWKNRLCHRITSHNLNHGRIDDTRVHLLQLLSVILYGKGVRTMIETNCFEENHLLAQKVLFKSHLKPSLDLPALAFSLSFCADYLLNDPLCSGWLKRTMVNI